MENIASSSKTAMDPDQTDPARPEYRGFTASTSRATVPYRLGPSRLRNMTVAVPVSQPIVPSGASPLTPIRLDDDDAEEDDDDEDQKEEEEEERSPIEEQLVKNTEKVLQEAKECSSMLQYTREELAGCYDTIDFLVEKVSVLESSFLENSEQAMHQFYSENLSKEFWTNKFKWGKTKIAKCLEQRELLKEELNKTRQELKVTKSLLAHSIDTFNRNQGLEQCETLKKKLNETEEELKISKDHLNSKEKEGPDETCNRHLCDVLEEKLQKSEMELQKTQEDLNSTRRQLNTKEKKRRTESLPPQHCSKCEMLLAKLKETQMELNSTRENPNSRERGGRKVTFNLQQCQECEKLREKLKETQKELKITSDHLKSKERETSNATDNRLCTELKYLTKVNSRLQEEIERLRAN